MKSLLIALTSIMSLLASAAHSQEGGTADAKPVSGGRQKAEQALAAEGWRTPLDREEIDRILADQGTLPISSHGHATANGRPGSDVVLLATEAGLVMCDIERAVKGPKKKHDLMIRSTCWPLAKRKTAQAETVRQGQVEAPPSDGAPATKEPGAAKQQPPGTEGISGAAPERTPAGEQ
jgi:hypothetical protein